MKVLNVMVWGLGKHAIKSILPAIRVAKNIKLQGVYTRNAQVLEEVAAQFKVRPFKSPDEFLSDNNIDVVILATPTGSHYEIGKRVLDAKKHLWCEKPLCANLKEAQALIDQAKSVDRVALECFMFLHHPQLTAIAKALNRGLIGQTRMVQAQFGVPHFDKSNVRYDAQLGGGALLDLGCYPLALSHYLFGKPDKVSGITFTENGYNVDTHGSALLSWTAKSHGTGISSQCTWGFGHEYQSNVKVWGSQGILTAERTFSKPPMLTTALQIQSQEFGDQEILVREANHFADMYDSFAREIQELGKGQRLMMQALERAQALSEVQNS